MATGNLNDYPEFKELHDRLRVERDEIEEKVKPLRDEYRAIQDEIGPKMRRMRELAKEWQAMERPRKIQIDQQLSAIARAIGGKRTSDEV